MSEKVTKVQGETGTDLRKHVFTSFPTDLSAASFVAADAQVLIVHLGQGKAVSSEVVATLLDSVH